jgi:hypothetical protein
MQSPISAVRVDCVAVWRFHCRCIGHPPGPVSTNPVVTAKATSHLSMDPLQRTHRPIVTVIRNSPTNDKRPNKPHFESNA